MKKIMIVESSAALAGMADSILRQGGYDVTCFDDGLAAADFARVEQPDLIISGLGLPGMDGIELCRKLSGDPLTGGIPVLLMVGQKDEPYFDKISLCGARGKINKPFTAGELLGVVQKFLGVSDSMRVTRIVDQESEDGPRLKKAGEEQAANQAGFARDMPDKEKQMGAPFNLDWESLSGQGADMNEASRKINLDDSSLTIDSDQYGLINPENARPAAKRSVPEDYSWFIDEMKREIEKSRPEETPAVRQSAGDPAQAVSAPMSYGDIGVSVSEDEGKYRQFLDEFKRDAGLIPKGKTAGPADTDIDRLAEAISEKLARKIIEKLSAEEIKRIISSVIRP